PIWYRPRRLAERLAGVLVVPHQVPDLPEPCPDLRHLLRWHRQVAGGVESPLVVPNRLRIGVGALGLLAGDPGVAPGLGVLTRLREVEGEDLGCSFAVIRDDELDHRARQSVKLTTAAIGEAPIRHVVDDGVAESLPLAAVGLEEAVEVPERGAVEGETRRPEISIHDVGSEAAAEHGDLTQDLSGERGESVDLFGDNR